MPVGAQIKCELKDGKLQEEGVLIKYGALIKINVRGTHTTTPLSGVKNIWVNPLGLLTIRDAKTGRIYRCEGGLKRYYSATAYDRAGSPKFLNLATEVVASIPNGKPMEDECVLM
jgi:hypothetical protein